MHLLSLHELYVGYGRGEAVVRGADLEVDGGTTVAVIGESGSGKTTLIRALVGLADVMGGEVVLEGVSVDPSSRTGIIRLRRAIQMIFQDPASSFDPRRTVGWSLREAAYLAGRPEQELEELVGRMSLSRQILDRRPGELSGGQAQRAAVARALVFKPRIIVADEPSSALDVSLQARIIRLFRSLKNDTSAMILVTHDIHVARMLADTAYVMLGGIIVEHGHARSVLSSPVHPYTRELLEAGTSSITPGIMPSVPPVFGEGCPYRARCPLADSRCAVLPDMHEHDGRMVRCHAQ